MVDLRYVLTKSCFNIRTDNTHHPDLEGPDGVLVQGGVGSELDDDVSVLNR